MKQARLKQIEEILEYCKNLDLTKAYFSVKIEKDLGISFNQNHLGGLDLIRELQAEIDSIDQLCETKPSDLKGRHLLIGEILDKYSVSPTTVSVWCKFGLMSRKLHDGLRFTRYYPLDYLEHFEKNNPNLVQSGGVDPKIGRRIAEAQKKLELAGVSFPEQLQILSEKFDKVEGYIKKALNTPEFNIFLDDERLVTDTFAATTQENNELRENSIVNRDISYFEVSDSNSDANIFFKYNLMKKKAVEAGKDHEDYSKMVLAAEEVRNQIVEENMGLVYEKARNIVNKFDRKLDFDEVLTIGSIHLMRIVDKFDPNRGFNFSTYAYVALNNELRSYAVKTVKAREPLEIVNIDELPTKTEFDPEPIYAAMEVLSEQEKSVIAIYFSLDSPARKTQEEMAAELGCSKQNMCRIKNEALAKMKKYFERENLDLDFLIRS